MKILISTQSFQPAWAYGGSPKLISDIARNLAIHNDITVLTTDVFDKDRRIEVREETIDNVRIIRFPTISNMLAWHMKIIIPRYFAGAVEAYIKGSDFVYLSDLRNWQHAAILPYLLKHKKPYSVAANGQIRKTMDLKYLPKLAFDLFWGERMIKNASFLVAQTEHEAGDYLEIGGRREQTHIMPLFSDLPSDKEMGRRNEVREKYKFNSNTCILLYVGRIHKLKGLDVLINAFALVRKNLPREDMRLIIIGVDDGYQGKLNSLISRLKLTNVVVQTGPLYGEENAAYYQDADLFVFTPTYYEETSLACVRALSFGLPVLTVHQSELPWLDEYGAGITAVCEPEAVADKLTMLFKNNNILREMRERAIKLFADHYRPKQVITALERAIQKAVQ